MRRLAVAAVSVSVGAALVPEIPARAASFSIASSDGLRIVLKGDGSVGGVSLHGSRLPATGAPGGFSVRRVRRSRNLLPNPRFERDRDRDGIPDGWKIRDAGNRPRIARRIARSGKRSVALRPLSAYLVTSVRVRPSVRYTYSAWFRSSRVRPTAPTAPSAGNTSPVRLAVRQLDAAGRVVGGRPRIYSYTNVAGWHLRAEGIHTTSRTTRLVIAISFRRGQGRAWVDDVALRGLFGRKPITPRARTSMRADGRVEQTARIPEERLRLWALYSARADHIRVDGRIRTTDRRDKPVQVTFTLPIDARRWMWGDHPRKARRIGRGIYSYLTRWNREPMSRYPFGLVYEGTRSLGMGVPLNRPRISRIVYDAKQGLTMTFDLGISPAAMGGGAPFSFILFTSDPAWGFRGAAQKYYEIFPSFFRRRTDAHREGMWYVKPALDVLDPPDTPEDESQPLGLGLNMIALGKDSNQSYSTWGVGYVKWDNDRGIYAHAYNHHWLYYHPKRRGTIVPAHGRLLDELRERARIVPTNYHETLVRDQARAALQSTARDVNGRLIYESYRRFVSLYQNLDALSGRYDWQEAALRHQVRRAMDLAASAGGRLDGIHLDSTAGMRRWAAAENYNRRHWRAATVPLSFSYRTGRVTQLGVFPIYAHIRRLADMQHAKGMLLSANFNGSEARSGAWFGADQIDYFGVEQALAYKASRDNDRHVTVDSFALFKRLLARHRPVSVIDHKAARGEIDLATIEQHIRNGLFYGIYFGVTGAGLTQGPLSTPEGKEILAHYTPILRALGEAGWEPITNARSSNSSVWVERFGSFSSNDAYLTLRNETTASQSYSITVALTSDGGCRAQAVSTTEMIQGAPVPVTVRDGGATAVVSGSIAARDTQALSFDVTPQHGCSN